MVERNQGRIADALAAVLRQSGMGVRIDINQVAFHVAESMNEQFKVLAMISANEEMFFEMVGQVFAVITSKFAPLDKENDTLESLTEARANVRKVIFDAMEKTIPRINKSDIIMRDVSKTLTPEMKRKMVDENKDMNGPPSESLQEVIDKINGLIDRDPISDAASRTD